MVTVGQTPSRNAKLPKTVYMVRVMILIMQNSLYTITTETHIRTFLCNLQPRRRYNGVISAAITHLIFHLSLNCVPKKQLNIFEFVSYMIPIRNNTNSYNQNSLNIAIFVILVIRITKQVALTSLFFTLLLSNKMIDLILYQFNVVLHNIWKMMI